MENYNPDLLSAVHGVSPIGASQRVIAYTAVASGGTGLLNITAASHGLKKLQCFYIGSGTYAGFYRVKKVINANTIQVEGTFSVTASGNINLTAHKEGFGFFCDATPLTIAEIDPESSNQDPAAFIATKFVVGAYYPFPFKKIRVSAGDITVVNKPPQASLSYTNR